jgi:DNA-directed RNA polymerase subunit omega
MNEINSSLENKYSLVKGAARRARQLQSGAPSLGVSNSLKACRVAEDEVRAGKVTFSVSAKKPEPPGGSDER